MTVTVHLNIEAKCASVSEKDVPGDSVRTAQGSRRGKVKDIRSNRNGHTTLQRRAVALPNDMGIVNLFCY
jgi:hypothetical protein